MSRRTMCDNPEMREAMRQYRQASRKMYATAGLKKSSRKKHKKSAGGKKWLDYYEYIESREWAKRWKRYGDKRGWRCECCRASGVVLHVHHLTYERLGDERDRDLQLLCETCHAEEHGLEPPMNSALDAEFLAIAA